MTDAAPRPDFPERGDNFVTRGPWRLLSGATWHSLQIAAEEAQARAASAVADEMTARRAGRRVARLKAEGPAPVRRPASPDARPFGLKAPR